MYSGGWRESEELEQCSDAVLSWSIVGTAAASKGIEGRFDLDLGRRLSASATMLDLARRSGSIVGQVSGIDCSLSPSEVRLSTVLSFFLACGLCAGLFGLYLG